MANLGKLDDVINDLESQSKELLDVSKALSKVDTLNEGLSKNLVSLNKSNKDFIKVAEQFQSAVNQGLEQLTSKVDEMYNENKRFYKEIDSLLHSLLEKHKSDIQVEIRDESQKLRKCVNEVQDVALKGFETLELNLIESNKKQAKSASFLLIIACLILGINALIVLKLLGVL